jgi:positive regulator of sigma E activity
MAFLLYFVGFIVFVSGLAWLATMLGIAQTYVMFGVLLLMGMGIFTAAARARMRDPA